MPPENQAEVPMGTIVATVQKPDSLPSGWLPCDGSSIPAQYGSLITMLGSDKTPNLIGRTLVGAGDPMAAATGQTDKRDPGFSALAQALQIGDTGGECRHKLSLVEMPSHRHTINNGDFGIHYRSFAGEDGSDHPYKTDADTSQGDTKVGDTHYEGGQEAHYNVQPYFSVTYIIRAAG
jgi:microcystin-dependent protein